MHRHFAGCPHPLSGPVRVRQKSVHGSIDTKDIREPMEGVLLDRGGLFLGQPEPFVIQIEDGGSLGFTQPPDISDPKERSQPGSLEFDVLMVLHCYVLVCRQGNVT